MKNLLGIIALALALAACSNSQDAKPAPPASENDVDAARNFIRAALDGKWSDARKFLVQDSVNNQIIDRTETRYEHMDRETRRGYREASIQLFDTRPIGDSASVVSYANSFMNKKDSLKVVRVGGQWLIDLKYSLLPSDSSSTHVR